MRSLGFFLADESGAVTLDWVALSAGIVLVAIGVIAAIADRVDFQVDTIDSRLQEAASQSLSL